MTTRMSQMLELLVWSCFFFTVQSQRDPVLPPRNLSLLWVTGFQQQLSWAPPQHSVENCTYKVIWKTNADPGQRLTSDVTEQFNIIMEGGFLNMTVATVCDGTESKPAWVSINAELVRDFKCYIYSATQSHCSWLPASQASDLRFFYKLPSEDFTQFGNETLRIQECSKYNYTAGVRTGCDLEANVRQSIIGLFNGTVNNTLASNTFKKAPADDVRPPPLHWTVTETEDAFVFSWTPPAIERDWKFSINYTECGIQKLIADATSKRLNRVPDCEYSISLKARVAEGETPWSDEKYFAANTDPDAWLYAAIIVPLTLAGLAALLIACYSKNKELICPIVPEPRDLLSDISDNNNKSAYHDLYVPTEEDEDCKITLVVDPLMDKLDF